jgi:glucose-6-phosphate dehydrogenase assembly protein OpcA
MDAGGGASDEAVTMSAAAATERGFPVAVGEIDEELQRLWRAAGEGGEDAALTRACVLNLVIVSETPGDDDLAAMIVDVTAEHPCRVLNISARPDQPGSHLAAFLSAFCRLAGKGRRQVCCEEIRLEAGGEAARHLHSTLAALLSEDLPVFVWWRGRPPFGSHRLMKLMEMADRFIVDTSAAADPVAAVMELARWNTGAAPTAVGDLAWRRLSPWREAVAALFDDPDHRAVLAGARQVQVAWGTGAACPGRSQALYLGGWLAARLGWRLQDAPVTGTAEGITQLLTRPGGEVMLVIRRGADGDSCLSILADDAGQEAGATAQVGWVGVPRSTLQRANRPPWEWRGTAMLEDTAATLARELDFRRSEPVFAESLAMAGDLAGRWQDTSGHSSSR